MVVDVDPFHDVEPDHFADLMLTPAAARRMWLGFEGAQLIHAECCAAAAYWERRCRDWDAANGRSVWRERHPLDRAKLRQRAFWRARRRISRRWLIEALPTWNGAEIIQ